jgi:hypothetical protein
MIYFQLEQYRLVVHRHLLHFPSLLLRYLKLKQQLKVGLALSALSSMPPTPRTARCVETILKTVVQPVVMVKPPSQYEKLNNAWNKSSRVDAEAALNDLSGGDTETPAKKLTMHVGPLPLR